MTTEDLTASIDALTRKLSDMPEWSGNLLDPVKSAELVAARWGAQEALVRREGAPSSSPTAPINPYAPNQVDESRKFRPSELARKVTYNLVILDGKKDYLADRQAIRQEVRSELARSWFPRRAGWGSTFRAMLRRWRPRQEARLHRP